MLAQWVLDEALAVVAFGLTVLYTLWRMMAPAAMIVLGRLLRTGKTTERHWGDGYLAGEITVIRMS